MVGDVDNFRGLVAVSTLLGDLEVRADVTAKTVDMDAGGDFVQGFIFGFRHPGGTPEANYAAKWKSEEKTLRETTLFGSWTQIANYASYPLPPATSSIVAGKNVLIAAELLNINGLIRS